MMTPRYLHKLKEMKLNKTFYNIYYLNAGGVEQTSVLMAISSHIMVLLSQINYDATLLDR